MAAKMGKIAVLVAILAEIMVRTRFLRRYGCIIQIAGAATYGTREIVQWKM